MVQEEEQRDSGGVGEERGNKKIKLRQSRIGLRENQRNKSMKLSYSFDFYLIYFLIWLSPLQ